VIALEPSLVTVRAMVAVPLLPASALVIGGTSLVGDRGTVKVDVVVPGEGAIGDESLHPTAKTLSHTAINESRVILFCLLDVAQKNFRARLKPR
jgi:hydrogenase maturation factor HypE